MLKYVLQSCHNYDNLFILADGMEMAYVVVLILVAIVVAAYIWGPDEEPAKPKSTPAPQRNVEQGLWSAEEERKAGTEINRLVAEFLEDCKQRNRVGRADLANRSRSMHVSEAESIEVSYCMTGQGWIYDSPYINCGFALSNEGEWRYVGCYTVLTHVGRHKEIQSWAAKYYGHGDRVIFEEIDLREYYTLVGRRHRDTNTAEPADALDIAKCAIEEWRASLSSGPNPTS